MSNIVQQSIPDLIESRYSEIKPYLKGIPIDGKIQLIADEVFQQVAAGTPENRQQELKSEIIDIVTRKMTDEAKSAVFDQVKETLKIDEFSIDDKIGYVYSATLQITGIDINKQNNRPFVLDIVKDVIHNFELNRFANRIQNAKERDLLREFPFLPKELNLAEKKEYLIKRYTEYQNNFALYNLSLLPSTIDRFHNVTNWESCVREFDLNQRPLSDQARTFIIFGYLATLVLNYRTGNEAANPAILHFINTNYPEIKDLTDTQLTHWSIFASVTVELIQKSSMQQITTPSLYPIQDETHRDAQEKTIIQFSEMENPVTITKQFHTDLGRVGQSSTKTKPLDEPEISVNPEPKEIYLNLEKIIPNDPNGFFVLQALYAQTLENAGLEWVLKDVSTRTGLLQDDVYRFAPCGILLAEKKAERVDQTTMRVTNTSDVHFSNPTRDDLLSSIPDVDRLGLPDLSTPSQYSYSCTVKCDEDGKWNAQSLKQPQPAQIPANEGLSESPPILLEEPKDDDKAAGKEEEKPAALTTPRSKESEPIALVASEWESSDPMVMFYLQNSKKPNQTSTPKSSEASSSQSTKEPQTSHTAEPAVLKDYWYMKKWVDFEKVPSYFEDSKELNRIIDQLNSLQGKDPSSQIRARDLLLFTKYARFRVKILQDKVNEGITLSLSESNEFSNIQAYTLKRLETLEEKKSLNGSQIDELDILKETRMRNPAPRVPKKDNPKPVVLSISSHEKDVPDDSDPALAEAIANAQKNSVFTPAEKIEEKTKSKTITWNEKAKKFDIDIKGDVVTKSEQPLKKRHVIRKKQSSHASRNYGSGLG